MIATLAVVSGITSSVAYAQKIYFAETTNELLPVRIQRCDLNGTNVEHLLDTGTPAEEAWGLAVDTAGGHIYWTERYEGKIRRADLDGGNPETLVTDAIGVFDIALDVPGGKMYWTQGDVGTIGIYRANLAGTDVEQLVAYEDGMGIALDLQASKVYWVSPHGWIKRADLDGGNVETLIDHEADWILFGIDLDVDGNKMYYTLGAPVPMPRVREIQRANLDGSGQETLVSFYDPTDSPSDIALDLLEGKMYWVTIVTGKIQRADLNGANLEDVFLGTTPYRPNAIGLGPGAQGAEGACCLSGGSCTVATESYCAANDGMYAGNDTTCADGNGNGLADVCEQVPAVSAWGLAVMVLLLLTAGTVLVVRRHATQM
jgi:hypothetical protein